MPLVKYAALPTARMSIFYAAVVYRDLAVIDFSTNGHGLYNYGHLLRLQPFFPDNAAARIFSTHITEVDIALGDRSRLDNAIREATEAGFRHILLMPSSIAAVLGFDLESDAVRLSRDFGVDVFTVPAGLNTDFYAGQTAFLLAMSRHFCGDGNGAHRDYQLLGGAPSLQARRSHDALSALLKDRLGLACGFDSLNATSVEDWAHANDAEISIVTAQSAVPTARHLQEKYGIPYCFACGLGRCEEEKFLEQVAAHFGLDGSARHDETYAFVLMQMKNILAVNRPAIVCYADVDRLLALSAVFEELETEVEMICSHENERYLHLLPDDFITRYAPRDVVVISYDRVCRAFPRAVEVDQMGLDFRLQTPLYRPDFGVQGAYLLFEQLSELFF